MEHNNQESLELDNIQDKSNAIEGSGLSEANAFEIEQNKKVSTGGSLHPE